MASWNEFIHWHDWVSYYPKMPLSEARNRYLQERISWEEQQLYRMNNQVAMSSHTSAAGVNTHRGAIRDENGDVIYDENDDPLYPG